MSFIVFCRAYVQQLSVADNIYPWADSQLRFHAECLRTASFQKLGQHLFPVVVAEEAGANLISLEGVASPMAPTRYDAQGGILIIELSTISFMVVMAFL